ncbi:MAG TPA: NAD(P)-dependent oxidoreductase [Terriglobales bacterium]|nr:NAD(P)-dependent oxidoreductase [Terriglobales bacterium]
MRVGFIGLGNMGQAMAQNLLKAGHELTVYNRSRNRTEPFQSAGAKVASSPADAARFAEVLITMLADDNALEDVLFEPGNAVQSLAKGAIHLSMSTISVALSQRLQTVHQQREQLYVSAPVFGRPRVAAEGKLFIVAAGPRTAIDKCDPLFSALGQRTFKIGEDPVSANVLKLSGNFLIASIIESLGEAVALVRKYGVDPAVYIEVLTGSLFAAPVFKTYGGLIAEEKYQPAGFRLHLGLKDIRLALAAAEAAAVPMPTASVIRDRALAGIANGLGDDDWSSLARIAAEQAGLPGSRH